MPCPSHPKGLDRGALIYLASPYSYTRSNNPVANQLMLEWNFQKVCEIAAEWMKRGYVVFCPITHSHPIAKYGGAPPEDWKFWAHQDLNILKRCDALVQARMPLWEKSKGAAAERGQAEAHDMAVSYTRNYYYDIDFRLFDRGLIDV